MDSEGADAIDPQRKFNQIFGSPFGNFALHAFAALGLCPLCSVSQKPRWRVTGAARPTGRWLPIDARGGAGADQSTTCAPAFNLTMLTSFTTRSVLMQAREHFFL
jgi:hypothetical protein